jgi:hypothetical protein
MITISSISIRNSFKEIKNNGSQTITSLRNEHPRFQFRVVLAVRGHWQTNYAVSSKTLNITHGNNHNELWRDRAPRILNCMGFQAFFPSDKKFSPDVRQKFRVATTSSLTRVGRVLALAPLISCNGSTESKFDGTKISATSRLSFGS